MEGLDDLTLDMLSEDGDISIDESSLGVDLDNVMEPKPQPVEEGKEGKDKDKDKDIASEGSPSPESVAGEKDKGKTSGKATNPSPDVDDSKLSHIYSSLATHLNKTGVLPSLTQDKKVENANQLQEAIKAEIDNAISERQKAYEQAMEAGEPQDAYVAYTKEMNQLNSITDEQLSSNENAQLRFNIIAQNFINKNFSKEDAIKYAKRSQELGEDEEDSKKALEEIKSYKEEAYKATVKAAKELEEANVKKIEDFIKGADSFIEGVEINQTVKDNLLKQMKTSVGRDEKGNALTAYGKALKDDPVKTKVMTEYMFLLTKGFTDFSSLNNAITSKKVSDIDNVLRDSGAFLENGKINSNQFDDQSSFSINDEFKLDI